MMEFKSRTKRNFYEILLKNEFDSEALAILVAHLCWKNLEMSRKFGKVLVRFYNKINERELIPSLVSLQYYMTL
jgi:hypothetical protein